MFLLPQLPQLLWRVGGSYGKTFTQLHISVTLSGPGTYLGINVDGWDFPRKKKFMSIFPFHDLMEKVIL